MVGISLYFLENVQDKSDWVEYRKYTKERLDEVYSGVMELEATHRGFVISGKEGVYETYNPTLKKIYGNLRVLDSLIGETSEQKENLDQLTALIEERIELLSRSVSLYRSGQSNTTDSLKYYVIEGDKVTDRLRMVFRRIDAREEVMLTERTRLLEEDQENALRSLFISTGIVLILFVVVFVSLFREYRSKRSAFDLKTRSEQRLIATLSVVGDAIMNLDEQGKVLTVNAGAEKIFVLEEPELKKKRLADLLLPVNTGSGEDGDEPLGVDSMRELVGKRIEMLGRRNDGSRFPVDLAVETYTYLEDHYYVATIRDISELKEKEEELRETLLDLQRSNTELEQFAYVASHDLQEPLRKIQAFGNRMLAKFKSGEDPESTQLYAEKMIQASGRMQKLILSLLEFSRISRNLEETSKVDLNTVVEDVLDDLDHLIRDHGVKVDVESLPVLHNGREIQLSQLFQNLIANAIKFRREGVPPEIRIRCREGRKSSWPHLRETDLYPGIYYQIEVRDNGLGFEMKYLDRIFTIFQRLHGRSEYEGTGIGLAVCQRVCENHGGWLTAESIPGEGSGFYVYLPKITS